MMEPDSKYHKERRLAIARLRILIIEQTWAASLGKDAGRVTIELHA
jgi:hypothetical protein